ncbi:MAG: hypothetical protein JW940_39335 [Polyangiaceae bacterium]|nr:hypothetical protein [Polyangiaceae bacterium]
MDHSKSSRFQQTLSLVTQLLLGIYLTAMGVGLSFFVYVLWPDFVRGEDGNLAWAGSIRVFSTPEGFALSDEPRLILLVLLTGALGSYVHAATSFVTYVGNRTLRASWTWWYLLRPFIGMVLALIFYFVIRGGLLSAGTEATGVSAFGVAAIAGLVGMFSKQATDKLQELFDSLFRTQAGKGDDQRQDKLTGRVSVTEKMIPTNKITAVQIPEGSSARNVTILDLYNKYGGVVTRLPVVDHRGVVLHVIHQSLLYKFISAWSVESSQARAQAQDLTALSLADFLAFPEMSELVTARAFVSQDATLDEARTEMENVPKCQDVFVTEHGTGDEPIKGWLTNVDIGRLCGRSTAAT